jgi:hypothetical protein
MTNITTYKREKSISNPFEGLVVDRPFSEMRKFTKKKTSLQTSNQHILDLY